MSRPKERRRTVGLVALFVVGAAGIAIAFVVTTPRGEATGETDASVRGTSVPHYPAAGSGVRTLVVYPGGTAEVSPPEGPLYSSLLSGTVPARPMMAQVLSDSNCAPDGDGVSHCENRLRLADGNLLIVRHNHRMMEVSCLSPGERVLVTAAVGSA